MFVCLLVFWLLFFEYEGPPFSFFSVIIEETIPTLILVEPFFFFF